MAMVFNSVEMFYLKHIPLWSQIGVSSHRDYNFYFPSAMNFVVENEMNKSENDKILVLSSESRRRFEVLIK